MKEKKPALWRAVLPHLILVLSAMMLVFFVIDRINTAMAFLNNDITKWILAVFALLAAFFAVAVIAEDEKRRKASRSGTKGEKDGQE